MTERDVPARVAKPAHAAKFWTALEAMQMRVSGRLWEFRRGAVVLGESSCFIPQTAVAAHRGWARWPPLSSMQSMHCVLK